MNVLQALCDYSQRKGTLPPTGYTDKAIPCVIVINDQGRFVNLEYDETPKGETPRKYRVVSGSRSSNISPYVFYDTGEYLLGIVPEKKSKAGESPEKQQEKQKKVEAATKKKHESFLSQCEEIASRYPANKKFAAVCSFYKNGGILQLQNDACWEIVKKMQAGLFSFRLQGDLEIVAEDGDLQVYVQSKNCGLQRGESVCLVTGKKCIPVVVSNAIHVAGGQASGVRLVSFQTNSGYDSYGKRQGENAPISKEASDAYNVALDVLLAKESRNRLVVGNRTYVFWASNTDEASKATEDALSVLLGIVQPDNSNPDYGVEKVRKAFDSVFSGVIKTDLDNRFFILGLAPNAARVAVSFWAEMPLKNFAEFLLKFLDDMEVVKKKKKKYPYKGLYPILKSISVTKAADAPENVKDAVFRSIIQGLPFPVTLIQAVIRRCRVEQTVTITRAAILKAYLNRLPDTQGKRMEKMLDKTNEDVGYLCGRLFATLEMVQSRANGKSTIGARYIGAASATPATVFGTLLGLSLHHEEKMSESQKVFFEQQKREILDKMPASGFPARLDLQEQANFFLGYYHQQQFLYTKKNVVDLTSETN